MSSAAAAAVADNLSSEQIRRDAERIKIKNRRKRYLDLHPEYFTNPDLELPDPVLYDVLVRRFQTDQERAEVNRVRDDRDTLEADLVRNAAKTAAMENPDPSSGVLYARVNGAIVGTYDDDDESWMAYMASNPTSTREVKWEEWKDVMCQRFLAGGDTDFPYETVDGDESLDHCTESENERFEKWLDEMEPEPESGSGSREWETGIQDY